MLTKKVSCNQVCCSSNFFLLFSSFSLQEIILSKIINKRVTACLLVWCIATRKLKFILYNRMEINKHFIVLYENTCTNLMTSTFTHYNTAPPFLLSHLLFLFFLLLCFFLHSLFNFTFYQKHYSISHFTKNTIQFHILPKTLFNFFVTIHHLLGFLSYFLLKMPYVMCLSSNILLLVLQDQLMTLKGLSE